MSNDYTIQLISLALDASLMRETAIANNVANANTKEYQTQSVNFEEQLNSGLMQIQDLADLSAIAPFYQQDDTQTSLDEQIALSVKNATQYRSLIKGLNHKLAIMKLALQGNNQS